MSSLPDRSESPRVPPPGRRSGSRMHPGWSCFWLAWLCGMMTGLTMVYVITHPDRGFLIYAGIAIALFWMGGKRAEKLTDRP